MTPTLPTEFYPPRQNPPLTIELVPVNSWFNNLRNALPQEDWDVIRRQAYQNAGYRCEICNGVGPKWPVECHEVWGYNDEEHIQTLERFEALCPNCHMVKHIGYARVQGKYGQAKIHLGQVNGWDAEMVESYINMAFMQHNIRNKFDWRVVYFGDNRTIRKLFADRVAKERIPQKQKAAAKVQRMSENDRRVAMEEFWAKKKKEQGVVPTPKPKPKQVIRKLNFD